MFLPVPEQIFKQMADSSLSCKKYQKSLVEKQNINEEDQSTKVEETSKLIDNQHVISEDAQKTERGNTEILGDAGEYEKPLVAKMRAKRRCIGERALESDEKNVDK